jgi:drug/metabolite transporter (DMT)-like permease
LNLLGWVSLFLFGIYYRLNPALDVSRAALVQVSIWCVGTIVMAIGVGLVHTGHEAGDPLAAIGALIILAGMLTFAWIVFKQERAPAKQPVMAPAE